MEIDIPAISRLFSSLLLVLSSLIQLLSGKKSLCSEKQEILKWVSESAGREIRSLQQLWDVGPICLGKYIEQLNSQDVTWWLLQDLARATFAVPQVMTKTDMCRSHLNAVAESKFLRLLKRLKEALERTAGNDSAHRLRVSSDIIAKGVALSSAYAGMRGVFFVYSFRNELEGIQIDMDGPGLAKVETKSRKDGLMVSYIASRSGMYTLVISKNNWFAPGSPFVVNIQDPPVGYKGSFGGTLWDKPDTDVSYTPPPIEQYSPPNSLFWDGEPDSVSKKKVDFEAFPSRPKKKKQLQKSKQQVVELSQIAAAIILARRFTNRMQSRIPELRVERPSDAQELNLWSNMLTPSPSSLREITYVSPEGATFPISVNGGRDGGREKWMESRGENYDDWLCSPSSDPNQGNETYLQSLICPVQEDRLSKLKKSPAPFTRSTQHNMVRPFNHGATPVSSNCPLKPQGHIWTQSVSIGVNTDEIWIGPKPGSVDQSPKSSKGVQVGRSFLSFEIRDNSFSLNDTETKSDDPKRRSKQETVREFLMSRAKKCDTFNSDDTSSSVTTNYSEKIIEMDLKVNYETIALTSTDDDELSQSEVRETKRYLSLNDTSYDVPSIVDSNCSSFKTDEAIKPFSIDKPSGNCEKIENERENARPSVDGIYKATLMSLDNSISALDKSSEGELSDNEMTPVEIPIGRTTDLLTPLTSPGIVKSNRTKPDKTYESIVSADGHLLTIIVGEEVEMPCNDHSPLIISYLSTSPCDALSGETSNETSQADNKKIELKHFRYLIKRNWTKKITSRRLIKQRSGTCKRQLRKTLSFIPKLSEHKNFGDARTNALYSFGSYPVKKDVVHIPTSVRAWKQFWDNIATKTEAKVRRDITVKNKHVPKKEIQPPQAEKLAERNSETSESLRDDEDRKRRFETAKQHFTKLEKERKFAPSSPTKSYVYDKSISPRKLNHHWDLKGLFDDFNRGLGKPGVANRLGVLASLHSVQPHFSVGGFQSQYPHLPVSSSSESSPILKRATSSGTDHDTSMQLISFESNIHNENSWISRTDYCRISDGGYHRISMQSMSLDPETGSQCIPGKAIMRGVSFDSSMQSISLGPEVQNASTLCSTLIHRKTIQEMAHDAPRHRTPLKSYIQEEERLLSRKKMVPGVNHGISTLSESLAPDIQNVSSPISRKGINPGMNGGTVILPISLEPEDNPPVSTTTPDKDHSTSMMLISLEPDDTQNVSSQVFRKASMPEMNADTLIQSIPLERHTQNEIPPVCRKTITPEMNHEPSMMLIQLETDVHSVNSPVSISRKNINTVTNKATETPTQPKSTELYIQNESPSVSRKTTTQSILLAPDITHIDTNTS